MITLRVKKLYAMIAAIVLAGLVAAGCAQYDESNSYNSPPPTFTQRGLDWIRISTPGGYETIVTACYKGDRIYIGLSHGVWTEPNNPNCKGAVK